MRTFYLILAIIGAIIPWLGFGSWFASHGVNLPLFIGAIFPNGAASAFTADVLISSVVFLVWSFTDARMLGITRWWVVIPANFLVGWSLALPLYLWLRENKIQAETVA